MFQLVTAATVVVLEAPHGYSYFYPSYTYRSFLPPGSCDCWSLSPACSGWKAVNTQDRTPIHHGADTQYHSSCCTFTLSTPPPLAHLHVGHTILRAPPALLWNTCCICSSSAVHTISNICRRNAERPPQLRARLHVTRHDTQKCKWGEFLSGSHRHKSSVKHMTASNLVFPVHLSRSVWTVGGNAWKCWQALSGKTWEIWRLNELQRTRTLKTKLHFKDLQYY